MLDNAPFTVAVLKDRDAHLVSSIVRLMLLQDINHSLRVLLKNPGFAAVAILSLALGIGANTAIFSIVDAVLLKWLPVSSPQELVVVGRNPKDPGVGFNYPDYEYIRDHNHVFSGVMVAGGGGALSMTVPDEGSHGASQLIQGSLVSGNYFSVLGVMPAMGRLFTPEDNKTPGAHPIAILSYNFWKTRFASDPRVLGRRITLNGSSFTVIGVTREGFTGTNIGNSPAVFLPVMMLQQVNANARNWNSRHYWWLTPIARLKPGVSVQKATADVDVLYQQIEQNDPERRPVPEFEKKEHELRNRAVLLPGNGGYSYLRNRFSKPLAVLGAVVGLVLLIACANVANLLLARAASRRKEIAIRVAIGAGRWRLVSQLVTEAVILAVIGGLAGLAFAYWSVRVLLSLLPTETFPTDLHLTPDLRLLGFAFGVSVLTGLICGIVPAIKATRPDVIAALKSDFTPRFARLDLRKALVVAQVALSLLLLVGAGLFVRSLENLRTLDPGFLRENVLMVQTSAGSIGYKGQRIRNFEDRLLAAASRLPGVRVASLAALTPLGNSRWNSGIVVQGHPWKPDEKPYLDFNAVSPHYFETMGIPILMGRDFSDQRQSCIFAGPAGERTAAWERTARAARAAARGDRQPDHGAEVLPQ